MIFLRWMPRTLPEPWNALVSTVATLTGALIPLVADTYAIPCSLSLISRYRFLSLSLSCLIHSFVCDQENKMNKQDYRVPRITLGTSLFRILLLEFTMSLSDLIVSVTRDQSLSTTWDWPNISSRHSAVQLASVPLNGLHPLLHRPIMHKSISIRISSQPKGLLPPLLFLRLKQRTTLSHKLHLGSCLLSTLCINSWYTCSEFWILAFTSSLSWTCLIPQLSWLQAPAALG